MSRFAALVSKCALAMPRFGYVSMRGGVFANAVALPSSSGSSVIFTDTLLSRLSEDETVAICAHELAHLELLRWGAASPGERREPPPHRRGRGDGPARARVVRLPGARTAPLGLAVRGRRGARLQWPVIGRRTRRPAICRAVALTGDAEALARALTTLHTIARRAAAMGSGSASACSTHPSLARRIRDIRASAGAAAATLDVPTGFRAGNRAPPLVTFDASASQLAGRDRRDARARLRRPRRSCA